MSIILLLRLSYAIKQQLGQPTVLLSVDECRMMSNVTRATEVALFRPVYTSVRVSVTPLWIDLSCFVICKTFGHGPNNSVQS